MSYRIELAKTGRAGCKNTYCKKNNVKIGKGELRLGVWVATDRFESWTWKHWGCVTGAQILNMQNYLAHPTRPGEYRWDFMDGLQGEEDNERIPEELQEKFKRAIIEGHVADEDWKGEPELNLAGKNSKTHYTPAEKARMEAQKEAAEGNSENEPESPLKGKTAPKKRGRAKAVPDEDEDDEEAFEPAKKRAKKGKKVDDAAEEKPAKKARGKKVKLESDDDAEVKPVVKKARGKNVKKEAVDEATDSQDEAEAKPKPAARKSRAKKAIKAEEDSDVPNEDEIEKKKAPKSKAKKAVKQEDDDEDTKPAKKVPSTKKTKTVAVGARRSNRNKKADLEEPVADNASMEVDDAEEDVPKEQENSVKEEEDEE